MPHPWRTDLAMAPGKLRTIVHDTATNKTEVFWLARGKQAPVMRPFDNKKLVDARAGGTYVVNSSPSTARRLTVNTSRLAGRVIRNVVPRPMRNVIPGKL
jgi:hypothetical protein